MNLLHCPQENIYGGVATRIWYAKTDDLGKMTLPSSEVNSRTISTTEISLKLKKTLYYIDVYLDRNSLSEKQKGNERKWKDVSELSFTLLGMNDKGLSFKSSIANEPLIFFIPDNNGIMWVLGTLKNPAYLSNSEANSGQKYDDDNVISMSFASNSKLHIYAGKIKDIAPKGAFTKGFTKGFRNSQ